MRITIRMHNSGGELDARQVSLAHVNEADPAEVSEAIKDALRDMLDEAVVEPGDSFSVEVS